MSPPGVLPGVLPRVLLVTGTDTGVGKTVVTAALAACLARQGSVAVLKPAQTGVTAGEAGDADEVARLSGVGSVHEGTRLEDPLAPTTAGRRAGIPLPSVADHAATVHELARSHDAVLVEGAGGLMVGLDSRGDGLAELAACLDLEFAFVVVVRAGLGTLNHSRLTMEALRSRGLACLGLVIGAWPAEPGLAERCNLADLPAVAGAALIGLVPEGVGGMTGDAFTESAVDWFTPPLGRGATH
jgi:dethiobiotin synthase